MTSNAKYAMEETEKLAAEFCRVLIEWLGPDQISLVNDENAKNDDTACASQDFCDANMAMLEAFARLDMDDPSAFDHNAPERTAVETMWDEAWTLARAAQFDPQECHYGEFVTVAHVAEERLVLKRDEYNFCADDYVTAGLPMYSQCEICKAHLGPDEAYPSKLKTIRCEKHIGKLGFVNAKSVKW